jgi:hypothetical protein
LSEELLTTITLGDWLLGEVMDDPLLEGGDVLDILTRLGKENPYCHAIDFSSNSIFNKNCVLTNVDLA